MRYLLERAGLTYEQDVQSVTQHVYNEESALLRVILLTEAASKSFFQSLRAKRPYWHDRSGGQKNDSPLRFERDFTTQERFERLPLHVLMHCLNSLDGSPFVGQSLRPDWNILQIWDPDGENFPSSGFVPPCGWICNLSPSYTSQV